MLGVLPFVEDPDLSVSAARVLAQHVPPCRGYALGPLCLWQCLSTKLLRSKLLRSNRVADVEGAQERRSTKGQGLLRKEGPPTYAILSRNLVLSRFTCFANGFHRAFNERHPDPAFVELSTKAILLSQSFQRKPSCFRRAFNKSHPAFVELSMKAILLL